MKPTVPPGFLDVLDFHLESPTSQQVVLDAPLRFRRAPDYLRSGPENARESASSSVTFIWNSTTSRPYRRDHKWGSR